MKKNNTNQLKELQKIELETLKEFDKICKNNNIKYTLIGGTLLGAIRHNGFIPWDDDIDVCMLRNDYNKFIEIQKKELNNKKYYFQSMETDDEFGLPFGKIRRKDSIHSEITCPLPEKKQGIWIDIFPIDKIEDNKILAFFTFVKVFYYKSIIAFKLNFSFASKGIRRIILNIIKFNSKFYSINKTKKKYYKLIEKSNKKKTSHCISHGGVYLLKETFPKELFEEIITHKFEDSDFNIPKNYDKYLTQIYGNYMKIPPKEKQISNHLVQNIKLPKK